MRLFAAWVNADPATDFAAGVLFGLLNTFAAVDATFGDVCSLDFFVVDMKASLGWVGNFVWPNVKVNRHFAACRVWARILAQTWCAAKCPVGRWVRPRRHSEF